MEASTEMSDESAGLSRTLKDCLPVGFIDYDGNIQSDRLIADPDVTAQVRSQPFGIFAWWTDVEISTLVETASARPTPLLVCSVCVCVC